MASRSELRIGWTQPLCDCCYAAWLLGRGEPPKTPHRLVNVPESELERCLVCGQPTSIYTRIDPELAKWHGYPKADSDA